MKKHILVHLSPERIPLAEQLVNLGFEVSIADGEAPAVRPDVLLFDSELDTAEPSILGAWATDRSVGRIGIGVAQGVDVTLPCDVTLRELATTVGLVARIVELRFSRFRRHQRERQWMQLALQDPLTGLPNRRAWESELVRHVESSASLCVALIDVDFFKLVNDRNGHNVGDLVLREVAIGIRAPLRQADVVARLGGDEFGLLIADLPRGVAESIVERLRKSVSRHLAELDLPAPTLSAGVVWSEDPSHWEPEFFYSAAAKSLMRAKQSARNCSVTYSEAND